MFVHAFIFITFLPYQVTSEISRNACIFTSQTMSYDYEHNKVVM